MCPQATGPKNRFKRAAFAFAASLVVVCLVGLYLILRTPGWYQPPVVPPADRQKVRDSLVGAEQAFTESLRADQPFVYHIYQDNVNCWIAMRREIYPLIDELVPPILNDPFVLFETGSITVGGRYLVAGADMVVSIEIEPTFEDNAIVLRAKAVRCGSFPIAKRLERLGLGRSGDVDKEDLWPGSPKMSGDLLSGFKIDAHAWWKNGGIAYQVKDITVKNGRLDLSIQPLGRRVDLNRNRHVSLDR
ncbi:MAG: hypothetical protein MI923_19455 [Phycisphaerales bacterium]|nr:hypothetical protein [Phycisphaerales bacterium]